MLAENNSPSAAIDKAVVDGDRRSTPLSMAAIDNAEANSDLSREVADASRAKVAAQEAAVRRCLCLCVLPTAFAAEPLPLPLCVCSTAFVAKKVPVALRPPGPIGGSERGRQCGSRCSSRRCMQGLQLKRRHVR